jgi:hypothetical protein
VLSLLASRVLVHASAGLWVQRLIETAPVGGEDDPTRWPDNDGQLDHPRGVLIDLVPAECARTHAALAGYGLALGGRLLKTFLGDGGEYYVGRMNDANPVDRTARRGG